MCYNFKDMSFLARHKLWLIFGTAALLQLFFFLPVSAECNPGSDPNCFGMEILYDATTKGNGRVVVGEIDLSQLNIGCSLDGGCNVTNFENLPTVNNVIDCFITGGVYGCAGDSYGGVPSGEAVILAKPSDGSAVFSWAPTGSFTVMSGCRSAYTLQNPGPADPYCQLNVTGFVDIRVVFHRPMVQTAVQRYGSGVVSSNRLNVSCYSPDLCVYNLGLNGESADITFRATPLPGSVFYGWTGGPCAGSSNPDCAFSLGQPAMINPVVLTAYFNPTLNVTKTGNGTVVSTSPFDGAINCGTGGSDCSEVVDGGTISLRANPDAGWHFTGWSGDAISCGSVNTCDITVNRVKNATADFSPNLTIIKSGNGNGTVTVLNTNYSCPPSCATPVTLTTGIILGASVHLTASLDNNSAFVIWTVSPPENISGPYAPVSCYDAVSPGNCYIALNSPTTVTAQFFLPGLTVIKSGAGSGTVTSSDNRINCGPTATCSADYNYGSAVTLSAVQDAGSVFTGWTVSGGGNSCIGTGPCTVYITSSVVTATANFSKPTVTVNVSGPGAVTSLPAGINCGNGNAVCSASFNTGAVDLIPAANSGSNFTGWSGGNGECDAVIGSCRIDAVAGNVVYTANFGNQVTLTVNKAGAGDGSFDIYNSGGNTILVSCPSGCATASYAAGAGTSLRVQADPAIGSYLLPTGFISSGSWTGCDSASGGSCTVSNLAANRSVTVEFVANAQRAVIVSVHGSTGGGIVSSISVYSTVLNQSTLGSLGVAGGGISCDPTCVEYYDSGTNVTLQATADATSELIGWNGCTTLQP